MNVGLISFAHFHAWTYGDILQEMERVTISAVSDSNVTRAQQAGNRYHCTFFADYHELLQDPMIDAVIICSETVQHAQIVVDAARARKAILCEKPMALTVDDAYRMLHECQKQKVYFQLALANRYLAPILNMREALCRRDLGTIRAVHSTNRGKIPGGWFVDPDLSGGGAIVDHTIHAVDILRSVLKADVTEVYAEVGYFGITKDVEEIALLTMEFDNGVIASHDPSWSYLHTRPEWGDLTFEFIGDHGSLWIDGFSQRMTVYEDSNLRETVAAVGYRKEYLMLREFLSHHNEQWSDLSFGIDGLRALEVTLAAYQSAALHRPITVGSV